MLVLAPAGGYTGGAVVSGAALDLYQAVNTRVDLDTSLQIVSEPRPGITYYPANQLASPVVLNLDSIGHTFDVYVSEDGVDQLLYKDVPVAAGVSAGVALAGVADGQAIKMQLKEPLSAPGKRVIYMPCWIRYDAP